MGGKGTITWGCRLVFHHCFCVSNSCYYDRQPPNIGKLGWFSHLIKGSRQAIDDALIYLEFVERHFMSAKDGATLKADILDRYPSYRAAGLVDIQNLFPDHVRVNSHFVSNYLLQMYLPTTR